jgi:alkylation response protein AidB-like acyl-CoA dehydrogenase
LSLLVPVVGRSDPPAGVAAARAGQDRGVTQAVDAHPLVLAAQRVAREVLAPRAAEVDASTVPRSHLDAIGAAGLLGMHAPERLGGTQAPAPVARRVAEVLAGADAATWFVQAQHHFAVRALAAHGGLDDRARDVASGRVVSGIAFSHLRRYPDRPITATAVPGGWRFDGVAPWYTGWGLNDVCLLAGATPSAEVVFGLVDARPAPGLAASAPMEVAALRAAVTVSLRLEGLVVPERDVVLRLPHEQWARSDLRAAVNVTPAVFGVTDAALTLLAETGTPGPAAGTAARLAEQVAVVRERAYALIDTVAPDEAVPERLELRARAQRLMIEATTALVVARAGRAMSLSDPAQRHAREALFLLVQAQTARARAAALDVWGT